MQLVAFRAAGSGAAPGPSISSLNPTSGAVGTSITISGTNFGSTQGTSTVAFNGTIAAPTSWSGTAIIVPVPTGATGGNVVVTVSSLASNGVNFTVASTVTQGIGLVQHASVDAGVTTSSSLAFSSGNTAGNWVAVVVRVGQSNDPITIADTNGNTYRQAIQSSMTVDSETLGIFYAENIRGGANAVTVSDSESATMRFAILEYSGIAASNSLESASFGEGSNAFPSSGNVTTASNGDLLVGEISSADPENFTAGNGYTIEGKVPAEPNTKLIAEVQIQSSGGTASASATLGATDPWGAVVAAFKAGTGETTAPPTVSITTPAAGSTVSGTISVTASASSSIGIASVQFRVDGSNVGSPLTSAPYTYSLNTTTLSNASHTLTAVAKDKSNNTATSPPVTIIVNNSAARRRQPFPSPHRHRGPRFPARSR